ncbi:MAG: hypothetical protein AAB421_01040 [Patescibacteria group bacterium]
MFVRLLVAVGALSLPVMAQAHTRWFSDSSIMPYITTEPTSLYLTIWAIIAAVVVAVAVYFERHRVLALDFLEPPGSHAFERAASTFTMVTGAFFVIAGTHEYLFSPNLTTDAGIPMIFVFAQIFIGLAFLVGLYPRIAAVGLATLWGATFLYTDVVSLLENVWVLSTAVFVFVAGNDYFSFMAIKSFDKWAKQFRCYGLSILRWGTGGTLLVLGFSEKILHPELGVHFLSLHPWNFMQLVGLPYSDYLFTLSAGSVEALFGLIFILGVATRLNALVLALFFTTPLFILGPIELAGHLPHFAAVVLLLLFGSGGYFKIAHPVSAHRRR